MTAQTIELLAICRVPDLRRVPPDPGIGDDTSIFAVPGRAQHCRRVPEFVELSSPEWQRILQVRPGITGPDALTFKDEGILLEAADDPKTCYRQDILPQKMAIQSQYAQERSFLGDLKVLFRTLGALRG